MFIICILQYGLLFILWNYSVFVDFFFLCLAALAAEDLDFERFHSVLQ